MRAILLNKAHLHLINTHANNWNHTTPFFLQKKKQTTMLISYNTPQHIA